MPEHANASLVRRLFTAFERKDAFALRGFFAEDAVWQVGGLTDGTYTSRLIDVLASDERAAVLYRATGRREGRELDIDQLLLFTLRDGVVTEVLALPSDRFAFDTFWGTT